MNFRKACAVVFVCAFLAKLDMDTTLPWLVIYMPLIALGVLFAIDTFAEIRELERMATEYENDASLVNGR